MTQLDQSSEFLFCDPSQLRESETNRNYWQVRPTIDRGGEWPGVRERGQPGDHCGRQYEGYELWRIEEFRANRVNSDLRRWHVSRRRLCPWCVQSVVPSLPQHLTVCELSQYR